MEKNSHFIWELLSSIQFLIEYSSYIDASCRAIFCDGDDDGGAAGGDAYSANAVIHRRAVCACDIG